MRPTFSGFVIAKQGMDVARANLQVTGQNLTNANSAGYTRQRVDTYARGSSGHNMRYASVNEAYIGEGVQIRGIKQLRDPYLDVRYRRENAKFGSSSAQKEALTDMGYIFDNATEDGFEAQFSDLVSQLQSLASKPTDPVAENIVKTSATMLLQMFNNCSNKIEQVKNQQMDTLKNGAIKEINECLVNIAQINASIKSAHVSGNPALELLDARNLMIDKLSGYMNIEVVTKNVSLGGGVEVEELSINLLTPNGDRVNLVDNDQFTQMEMTTSDSGQIGVRLLDSEGKPVETSLNGSLNFVDGEISGVLDTGAVQGYLKMLNAKGEFGDPPNKTRGIAYYEGMMNTLASEFARVMNEANSTEGNNKPLFASKDGGPITAANIVISQEWEKATGNYITSTKKTPEPGTDNSDDSSNILYMISLFNQKQDFKTEAGYPLFSGTFHECVSHISTTLGLEIKDITRQNLTNDISLSDLQSQRDSVSSVNVDEEGINLIMYNQALTAASRFMTTLDEAVDTIINKMGIVGR